MRRGIGRLRAGGSSNPIPALFAAGEQGGWYDPSDFSTMFQDTAGSTPVTATSQAVARINDKSGRGNNLTQSTAGSRPILRQDGSGFYYLDFDGLDDSMACASVTLSTLNKALITIGLNKTFDSTEAEVFSGSGTIAAEICAPDFQSAGGAKGFSAQLHSTTSFNTMFVSNMQAPASKVVSGVIDSTGVTAAGQVALRVNAVGVGTVGTIATAANFSNGTLIVGTRGGTNPFTGGVYQLVARYTTVATDSASITQVEQYVGRKMGLSF